MGKLDGRVAVITSGSTGIGRGIGEAFLAEGARIVINGRDPEKGARALKEINAGERGHFIRGDVTVREDIDAVVGGAVEHFGRIDILVNNAALFAPLQEQKVTEIDVGLWDRVMSINIRGVFLMTKHVAPHMIAQKYGKIINISSGTVARGIPNFAHYVTSKGAVTAFTRSVSRELGEHNICVNNLAPGFTLSDSVINENPGHLAHSQAPSLARRALKRDEYPEDLLGALVFLASADSDFVTGQTIAVDGGATNN
jgi:NAD(P)-dependent dehydrogenase (short-subunit alcohol dehydrogenase family)